MLRNTEMPVGIWNYVMVVWRLTEETIDVSEKNLFFLTIHSNYFWSESAGIA